LATQSSSGAKCQPEPSAGTHQSLAIPQALGGGSTSSDLLPVSCLHNLLSLRGVDPLPAFLQESSRRRGSALRAVEVVGSSTTRTAGWRSRPSHRLSMLFSRIEVPEIKIRKRACPRGARDAAPLPDDLSPPLHPGPSLVGWSAILGGHHRFIARWRAPVPPWTMGRG
jgi:hypothetical protein